MAPKSNQVAKKITMKKQPKPKQIVVKAPTNKSVRMRGPTNQQGAKRQEIILDVTPGAHEFILHPAYIPWLDRIAPCFQKWGLSGMQVKYEPTVGTSTDGTVGFAVMEDFKDAIPQDLKSLSRVKHSQRGAPWDQYTLSCPKSRLCDYASKADFQALSPEDKNKRALGRIVVVTEGISGDKSVGRLVLYYNEKLVDPTDPLLQLGLQGTAPSSG